MWMKTKISPTKLNGRMRPNTYILFFKTSKIFVQPSHELDFLNLKLEKRKDAKPNKKAFLSFEIYTYGIGPKFPENKITLFNK